MAELKAKFLENGGILLKRDKNNSGEPVILQKKKDTDWTVRLTFSTESIRNKNFEYLTRKQKQFFKSDE